LIITTLFVTDRTTVPVYDCSAFYQSIKRPHSYADPISIGNILSQHGNTGCRRLHDTDIKEGTLVVVQHIPNLYKNNDRGEMFSFNILSVLILAIPKGI